MAKLTLDISQMKHLKNLGVDNSLASVALIYTNSYGEIVDWDIVDKDIDEEDIEVCTPYLRRLYGAFTLKDLSELLPKKIQPNNKGILYHLEIIYDEDNIWKVSYTDNFNALEYFYNKLLIDALYEMFCWCIENKFINF